MSFFYWIRHSSLVKISFKSKYNMIPPRQNLSLLSWPKSEKFYRKDNKKKQYWKSKHVMLFSLLYTPMWVFWSRKVKNNLYPHICYTQFSHGVLLPPTCAAFIFTYNFIAASIAFSHFYTRPWLFKEHMVRRSTSKRWWQSYIFFSFSGQEWEDKWFTELFHLMFMCRIRLDEKYQRVY